MRKRICLVVLSLLLLSGCGAKQGSLPSTTAPDTEGIIDDEQIPQEQWDTPDTRVGEDGELIVDDEVPAETDTSQENEDEESVEGEEIEEGTQTETPVEEVLVYRSIYRDRADAAAVQGFLQEFFSDARTEKDTFNRAVLNDYPTLSVKESVLQFLSAEPGTDTTVKKVTLHLLLSVEETNTYFAEVSCQRYVVLPAELDISPFYSTQDYVAECVIDKDSNVLSCTLYATDTSQYIFQDDGPQGDEDTSSDEQAGEDPSLFLPETPSGDENQGSTIPQGPGGWEMLDPSDPDFVQMD